MVALNGTRVVEGLWQPISSRGGCIMTFFKHVEIHKYDLTDKDISQACYDEMKAEGYDIVITEKEMRVLADHRREEFKDYMRPLFAPLED